MFRFSARFRENRFCLTNRKKWKEKCHSKEERDWHASWNPFEISPKVTGWNVLPRGFQAPRSSSSPVGFKSQKGVVKISSPLQRKTHANVECYRRCDGLKWWLAAHLSSEWSTWHVYIYICLYIIYPFIKSQVWGLSWWFVGPGFLTLGFWRVTPIITSSQGTLPKTRKLAWTPKIPIFERKLLFHNPSFLGFMLVFGGVFVCNNSKEDEGRISFVWSFLCLTPLWTSTVLLWPLPCVGRSWSIGYAEVIFHWWVRLSYRTHTF